MPDATKPGAPPQTELTRPTPSERGAAAMERLGEIGTAALDKTATLAEGAPEVTAVRPTPDCARRGRAARARRRGRAPQRAPLGQRDRGRGTGPRPGQRTRRGLHGRTGARGDGHDRGAGRERRPGGSPGPSGQRRPRGRRPDDVRRHPCRHLALTDRLRPEAPATTAALTALTGAAPTLLTRRRRPRGLDRAGGAERAAAAVRVRVAIRAGPGHTRLMSDSRQPRPVAWPMLDVCRTGCTPTRSVVCAPSSPRTRASTAGSSRPS